MDEAAYITLLSNLVGVVSTCDGSNLALIEFVEAYLRPFGVAVERFGGETPDKANLWVTIGPADRPGYVLSGHSDTVAVSGQAWSSDPFTLRVDGNRLHGRGTTDMKGFLAVCLAHLPEMVAEPLQRSIHLAISCDEELGCRGIPFLLDGISGRAPKPLGCFVGEPTGMQVVTSHKGSRRFRTVFRGTSGHTSSAPRHVNAVEWAAELSVKIRQVAREIISSRPQDDRYDIPFSTLLTTTFHGGHARNIVPDLCTLEWECRSIPRDEDALLPELIISYANEELLRGMRAIWPDASVSTEQISTCLSLDISKDQALVGLAQRLTCAATSGSVNFGTEAGFFARAGIPAVVIGPGSIEQAHKPDEYIERSELLSCGRFVSKLVAECRL
jgi:acetylornithine deacetylase